MKSTTVFFSPGNEQAAATVASTFAGCTPTKLPEDLTLTNAADTTCK
jgi:hypothetical protein